MLEWEEAKVTSGKVWIENRDAWQVDEKKETKLRDVQNMR
jgi:hypothetical protein